MKNMWIIYNPRKIKITVPLNQCLDIKSYYTLIIEYG